MSHRTLLLLAQRMAGPLPQDPTCPPSSTPSVAPCPSKCSLTWVSSWQWMRVSTEVASVVKLAELEVRLPAIQCTHAVC